MSHLLQARVAMLDWPDDRRIRACREEFWLNYPLAVSIIDHIREMIDLPPRTAARCLGIIGESGLGKTTLCNRLLSQINQPNPEKILYLDLSKHGKNLDLFKLVHSAMGLTIPPRMRGTVEEVSMFHARVEEMGLKAILLDEAQALDRTTLVRLAMSNLTTIRGLANSGVCVIALGIEDLKKVLEDKELDGRFKVLRLERWGDKSATLSRFLKACVGYFPLKEQSFLDTPTMQMLLVGKYGIPLRQLMELLQDCAVYAIRHGIECITEDVVTAVKKFG